MVKQNKKLIYLDAVRLMQCHLFLNLFYREARQLGIEDIDKSMCSIYQFGMNLTLTCTEIVFAGCFLAQEIGETRSVASGLSTSNDFAGEVEGMTWLIEDKRSPIVDKFTGTLAHGRSGSRGRTAETVHAFAHFVYNLTGGKLVVADLQGEFPYF